MSCFAWSMGMSFFGMPLYILAMCPENRDESKGNSIIKLWLQFIPIFGALHSQLHEEHTQKRPPHAPHMHRFSVKEHTTKKDISMLFPYSVS
jgi:hypothetical protein